jgi:uncharacterized membrane protein HdeD (DUF308 family)
MRNDTPLERIASKWWVPVLIGVLSVGVGIMALGYEGITLLALGLIFGIDILLYGMFSLAIGFEPGAPPSHAMLRVVIGVLAILAGLVMIVRPGASVLVLVIVLGFWFVIVGVGDLVRGITQPGQRWVAIPLGLIGIAAGVIVLGDPDIGLRTLAILAGILFIVRGIVEIGEGWELRRIHAA